MTEFPFPNREHEKADAAARRRALKAVGDLSDELALMRNVLQRGPAYRVDADMADIIAQKTHKLAGFLGEMGALYDVREWHAADLASDLPSHASDAQVHSLHSDRSSDNAP